MTCAAKRMMQFGILETSVAQYGEPYITASQRVVPKSLITPATARDAITVTRIIFRPDRSLLWKANP